MHWYLDTGGIPVFLWQMHITKKESDFALRQRCLKPDQASYVGRKERTLLFPENGCDFVTVVSIEFAPYPAKNICWKRLFLLVFLNTTYHIEIRFMAACRRFSEHFVVAIFRKEEFWLCVNTSDSNRSSRARFKSALRMTYPQKWTRADVFGEPWKSRMDQDILLCSTNSMLNFHCGDGYSQKVHLSSKSALAFFVSIKLTIFLVFVTQTKWIADSGELVQEMKTVM